MHAEAQTEGLRKASLLATAKRWGGAAFLLLVLALLAKLARDVDWAEAVAALQRLPAATLWAAAGLCVVSHSIYAGYDLIGRQQTGHGLPVPRTASVSFMSYAFNLNLGSLVGGIAFRYRLYSRLGLAVDVITRVLVLSLLTNWLGYFALAGVTLLLWPPELPASWGLAHSVLPIIGGVLLAAVAAYVGSCFGLRKRQWQWRQHQITLPSGRIALLQLVLATTSWLVITSIVWTLLQQQVTFPLVLGALLTAAVAGVIAHVPAGLGVLEAVFVLLLSRHVAQGELLGALLAYRALYYLAPLLVATGMFFVVDIAHGKRKGGRSRLPS